MKRIIFSLFMSVVLVTSFSVMAQDNVKEEKVPCKQKKEQCEKKKEQCKKKKEKGCQKEAEKKPCCKANKEKQAGCCKAKEQEKQQEQETIAETKSCGKK